MRLFTFLIVVILFACDNKTATYYYNLACDEEAKGNLIEAIGFLDKAIEKNSKDIMAFNNRGMDYLELKQYEKAKADFEKMVELDKNCPGAYYALGFLNYEQQNYKEAIVYFDKTIQIKGGGPVFLEHVNNDYTDSPFSVDVPIKKVYEYKNLSEEKLKK